MKKVLISLLIGCVALGVGCGEKTVSKVEILPYHDLGKFKWENLNVPYELENVKAPTNEDVARAKEILNFGDGPKSSFSEHN